MALDRPVAPDPYELLPTVPSFAVTSESFEDGATLPDRHVYDDGGYPGANMSPHLAWSGFPEETESFVVTCFDPDAPTPAGFWHWAVIGLPASCTELEVDAGTLDGDDLPRGAFTLSNDMGTRDYLGPCPPPGDRAHRYVFAVHALDTADLDIRDSSTPTAAAFQYLSHTIARGTITGTYAEPPREA